MSSGGDRLGVVRRCIQGPGNNLNKDTVVKSKIALGRSELTSLARGEMKCYFGVIVLKKKKCIEIHENLKFLSSKLTTSELSCKSSLFVRSKYIQK